MKNLKRFMFIFVLCYSCDNPEYINIPQDKRPLFKNNDVVVFTGETQNIADTFQIALEDYYVDSDKKYFHENLRIKYKRLNKTSGYPIFLIQQEESSSISTFWYNYPTIYGQEKTINMNINGRDYSSVYTLSKVSNWPDSVPASVYYTHKYGIIKYSFIDGRTFKLK